MNALNFKSFEAAADAWAHARGYRNAQVVPLAEAGEMAAFVAQQSASSVSDVMSALFATVEKTATDAKAAGFDGAPSASTLGHQALPENNPIAVRAGLVDSLKEQDPRFRQVVSDFEKTRITLSSSVSDSTLAQLYEAVTQLLARFSELEAGSTSPQVRREIVRLYDDLVSRSAQSRGVFIVRDDDPVARLSIVSPKPSISPAASSVSFEAIDKVARDDGTPYLSAEKPRTLGRVPRLGVDADGNRVLFEVHEQVGEPMTLEEFAEGYQAELSASHGSKQLETLSKAQLDKLKGSIEWISVR
ncbi:MAG: hypothetical protein AAF658_22100, partial [Myxococcota bacterium]